MHLLQLAIESDRDACVWSIDLDAPLIMVGAEDAEATWLSDIANAFFLPSDFEDLSLHGPEGTQPLKPQVHLTMRNEAGRTFIASRDFATGSYSIKERVLTDGGASPQERELGHSKRDVMQVLRVQAQLPGEEASVRFYRMHKSEFPFPGEIEAHGESASNDEPAADQASSQTSMENPHTAHPAVGTFEPSSSEPFGANGQESRTVEERFAEDLKRVTKAITDVKRRSSIDETILELTSQKERRNKSQTEMRRLQEEAEHLAENASKHAYVAHLPDDFLPKTAHLIREIEAENQKIARVNEERRVEREALKKYAPLLGKRAASLDTDRGVPFHFFDTVLLSVLSLSVFFFAVSLFGRIFVESLRYATLINLLLLTAGLWRSFQIIRAFEFRDALRDRDLKAIRARQEIEKAAAKAEEAYAAYLAEFQVSANQVAQVESDKKTYTDSKQRLAMVQQELAKWRALVAAEQRSLDQIDDQIRRLSDERLSLGHLPNLEVLEDDLKCLRENKGRSPVSAAFSAPLRPKTPSEDRGSSNQKDNSLANRLVWLFEGVDYVWATRTVDEVIDSILPAANDFLQAAAHQRVHLRSINPKTGMVDCQVENQTAKPILAETLEPFVQNLIYACVKLSMMRACQSMARSPLYLEEIELCMTSRNSAQRGRIDTETFQGFVRSLVEDSQVLMKTTVPHIFSGIGRLIFHEPK